jgi:hypothetical protein
MSGMTEGGKVAWFWAVVAGLRSFAEFRMTMPGSLE